MIVATTTSGQPTRGARLWQLEVSNLGRCTIRCLVVALLTGGARAGTRADQKFEDVMELRGLAASVKPSHTTAITIVVG